MTETPTVLLNNKVEMPQLGFGVFLVPPDEVVEPVLVIPPVTAVEVLLPACDWLLPDCPNGSWPRP